MIQPDQTARREADEPLVSVLIVNYNYETFLATAIESVLSQTYDRFEIVVCDDGSTDGSVPLIRSYMKEHTDVVRGVFKENGGVASALNAAFQAAEGDIICFLDADDFFARNKLERVVRTFLEDPSVGLVVNRLIKFSAEEETTGLIPQFGRLDRGWIRDQLLHSGGHWSFAPTSGISLRRDCAVQVFPIPEDQFRSEADSYIFTQAPMGWKVAALDEPLSHYRLHSSNLTSSEHITPAYATRVLAGIERMCTALAATAEQRGLPKPHLRDNPVYGEMRLVKDYLEGARKSVLAGDLAKFWRSAFRYQGGDRWKYRAKPAILTVISLLPAGAGVRLLEAMYLPTRGRKAIATRQLTRFLGREV